MGNGLQSQRRDQPVRSRRYNVREAAYDRRHQQRRADDQERENGDGRPDNTTARTTARRQNIPFYFKDKYDAAERTPRVPPALGYTKFWESPFEKLPYVEPKVFPIVWPEGLWHDDLDLDSTDSFPRFLNRFLNRDLRLFIQIDGTSNGPGTLEPYPEAQYILRNLRYLKVKFMHHPLSDGIRVSVEENHGHKRMRQPRFRPMYPKMIIPDHINQTLAISGEEFLLLLYAPHPALSPSHFPEGNGEVPRFIGTYSRELDTNPSIYVEYSVALYRWYNQTEDYILQL